MQSELVTSELIQTPKSFESEGNLLDTLDNMQNEA